MTEASILPDQRISGAYCIKIPSTEVALTLLCCTANTHLDMYTCKIHARFNNIVQIKK